MSETVKCPECDGGWKMVEEDGRMIRDACYHCGNTGKIPAEQYQHDRLRWAAEALATMKLNQVIEACNSNPDGEGWAFQAAENRCTQYEYNLGVHGEYSDSILKTLEEFQKANPEVVGLILDVMLPENNPDTEDVDEQFEQFEEPPASTASDEAPVTVQPRPRASLAPEDDVPF